MFGFRKYRHISRRQKPERTDERNAAASDTPARGR